MEPRINYAKASPVAVKAMLDMTKAVHETGLEATLLELVKVRASQINECAYCIDMHWKDARVLGESEQRLYGLSAWREAPYYTDRERAALEWTESLTLISENHVPDEVFERVRKHFTETELANLTLAVANINSWNRFAIAFRAVPGSYQPRAAHAPAQPQHA